MLTKKLFFNRAADERGTTLVLMSLLLVSLMGMSALVLDLGNARRVKRDAQGIGDAAALAAAQELSNTSLSPTDRMASATAVAKAYVERNLAAPAGGWAAAWASCPSPSPYFPSAVTPCVSFDNLGSPSKVRVRVPTQQVAAQFAKTIGGGDIGVSASATASVPVSTGFARNVLPFAHGPAGEKTWTKRTTRPRDSSPTLGINTIFDNTNLATWSRSCKQVDSGSKQACVIKSPRLNTFTQVTDQYEALKVNLSLGLDHQLATYPPNMPFNGPPTRVCDGPVVSPCTVSGTNSVLANHVDLASGSKWDPGGADCGFLCTTPPQWVDDGTGSISLWEAAVHQGMILGFTAGGSNFCARLARPPITSGNIDQAMPASCGSSAAGAVPGEDLRPTVTIDSKTVNGRHIGYYMTDAALNHFWINNASGNPSGSGCDGQGGKNMVLGDQYVNNLGWSTWTTPNKTGGTGAVDGETRFNKFLQKDTIPYLCLNPPTGTFLKKDIVRDPRFAWMIIIQNECTNTGNAWGSGTSQWDWSHAGKGGFNWNKDPIQSCSINKAKYILEFRAIFIKDVSMVSHSTTTCQLLIICTTTTTYSLGDITAWVFDPAIIENWTSMLPSGPAIEYQGENGPGGPPSLYN